MSVGNWLTVALKIKSTTVRKQSFLAIDEAIMPSALTRKIYGKTSHAKLNTVSRNLIELSRLGVVTVINPEERWGRYYALTALGKKVKNYLEGKR